MTTSLFEVRCKHCGCTIRETITVAVGLVLKGADPDRADYCWRGPKKGAEHEFDTTEGVQRQFGTKI